MRASSPDRGRRHDRAHRVAGGRRHPCGPWVSRPPGWSSSPIPAPRAGTRASSCASVGPVRPTAQHRPPGPLAAAATRWRRIPCVAAEQLGQQRVHRPSTPPCGRVARSRDEMAAQPGGRPRGVGQCGWNGPTPGARRRVAAWAVRGEAVMSLRWLQRDAVTWNRRRPVLAPVRRRGPEPVDPDVHRSCASRLNSASLSRSSAGERSGRARPTTRRPTVGGQPGAATAPSARGSTLKDEPGGLASDRDRPNSSISSPST